MTRQQNNKTTNTQELETTTRRLKISPFQVFLLKWHFHLHDRSMNLCNNFLKRLGFVVGSVIQPLGSRRLAGAPVLTALPSQPVMERP